MTQTIKRSTKSAITTEVVDRFQAAKRYGLDCFAVYDAIRAGKLTPIAIGKRNESLVLTVHMEAWLANLTPQEAVTVFQCTRKGCDTKTDKSAHHESRVTPDGLPIHSRLVYDDYEREPGSNRLHFTPYEERDPHWTVALEAVGDQPWRIVVEITNYQTWPGSEISSHGITHYGVPREIPNGEGLLEKITEAVNLRDKLNAELAR